MSHGDEIKRVFDDPSRFTFDPADIEVSIIDAVARLATMTDVTFAALYNGGTVDGDFSRDSGDLTGAATGGASTDGLGALDLLGGTLRFVDYQSADNIETFLTLGAVRAIIATGYSGSPPSNQTFWTIGRTGNDNNLITLGQVTTGDLILNVHSNNGSLIMSRNFGQISPAAGVSFEVEINLDIVVGATSSFVDGIKLGATDTSTGTRMPSLDFLRAGSNRVGTRTADFKILEIAVFDVVQHTANYIPGASGLLFSKNNPTIKSAATTLVTAVFTATRIASIDNPLSLDLIKHVMEIGGVDNHFDLSLPIPAWVFADLSTPASRLANSNLIEELTPAALALLPLNPLGSLLRLIDVVHSEDGLTTPELTSTTLGIEFIPPAIPVPRECFVFGRVLDLEGRIKVGVEVVFSHDGFLHGSNQIEREIGDVAQTLTDSNGDWQLQVIETQSIGLSPYDVRIDDACWVDIQVPDVPNAEFGTFSGQPVAT